MDDFTKWDYISDVDYTPWDDQIGGASETMWDLLPSVIGRGFRILWNATVRGIAWT